MEKYTIELDEYQIANLKAVFEAAGYNWHTTKIKDNPIFAINTGDWLSEIYVALPKVQYLPNKSATEIAQEALLRASHLLREKTKDPVIEVKMVEIPAFIQKAITENFQKNKNE